MGTCYSSLSSDAVRLETGHPPLDNWGFDCTAEPIKVRLLQEVTESLQIQVQLMLAQSHKSLEGGKWHHACTEVICVRLCAILSRSKEVLKNFGEFYCLRLVLDDRSPLASFFIDLFSHLELLLLQLDSVLYHNPCRPDHQFADANLKVYIHRSLQILRPVTSTCRLLYATCNMLPCMISAVGQTTDEEFKRKGQRQGRQFSDNLLLCRMHHMVSVCLDQPGRSRVKLAQELGTGSYAKVYKGVFEEAPDPCGCRCLRPGQSVAVKMFGGAESSAASCGFSGQLRQSMQQMSTHELEKLVIAKHPNIVTPMGYIGERKQGECGFVMELMDESLSDHLKKVNNGSIPPLEEVDMLDLMLEIARGVRFLHECELIHLDLKPGNVLLRFSDGHDHQPPEVKIADLGLTILKKINGCREKVGTSCYMAPELQVDAPSGNVNYDDKVDVFSFGTTCFNILMGNPDPQDFATTRDNFYAAIKAGEWKQWVQGRNPFVVKLIGKCWEMDPSMRPTFATLCVLLQHAIECYMVPDTEQVSQEVLGTFPVGKESPFLSTSPPSLWKDKGNGLSFPKRKEFKTSRVSRSLASISVSRSLASISGWSKEHKDVREPDHLRVYAAISQYLDQESGIVPADFEVMKRSVLQFESHVSANANVLSLDNLFPPWMEKLLKKLHVYDYQEDEREPQVNFQTTIMESCLDATDPLMFLKAQAYINLLSLNPGGQKWSVGALSSMMQQPSCLFKFSEDAAQAPIEVDTSLISSLVSFWKILPPFLET